MQIIRTSILLDSTKYHANTIHVATYTTISIARRTILLPRNYVYELRYLLLRGELEHNNFLILSGQSPAFQIPTMDGTSGPDKTYLTTIAIVFTIVITVVAVALRIIARRMKKIPLGADDYWIFVGAVSLLKPLTTDRTLTSL